MPFIHNLYVSTSSDTLAINVGLRNRTGNLFARIHTDDNDTYTEEEDLKDLVIIDEEELELGE